MKKERTSVDYLWMVYQTDRMDFDFIFHVNCLFAPALILCVQYGFAYVNIRPPSQAFLCIINIPIKIIYNK